MIPVHVDPRELYCTPVMFARFVFDLLIFCARVVAGIRHNKQKSVYTAHIYSYVIYISNRRKTFPDTALKFGGCIKDPRDAVL